MAQVPETQQRRGTCSRQSDLVLELARRQHGVVSRQQLLGLGLTSSAIRRRVDSKRLVRLYPGVYALGIELLTDRGRWMAAVLAAGRGAVLSHRSAAALWGIMGEGPRVEVSRSFTLKRVPGLAPGCGHPGLRVRRIRHLPAEYVTERFGIPVMTVERTLVALAETASRYQLESALNAALRSASLRLDALDLVLRQETGRRGSGRLRALAKDVAPVDPKSRSSLEDRFIAACLRAGLPRPRVNALIEGLEVDLLWNRERLIIELDGFEYHRDRLAFERDRERDAHLARAGYRVIRFTFRAVEHRLEDCISTVRELLDGA